MSPTAKLILIIAAANGGLAVILGAFGAHGLKGSISDTMLAAWQTGVQYHFYHTFALLVVALLFVQGVSSYWLSIASGLFVAGILFFSGSLYGLALGGPRWLGPITPLGGLMFIFGWGALCVAVLRVKS
ncbi:DUF423 domain-containing protein [Teredinibacter haidensis]|uniref:DUF423 domain-containing protein n=1 Tax=Teredinibacter haidensis TaxID=2731755 RepID=UPI000948ACAF|nr:DUF423 domain-containing protein [Teredinibacter haidensis]